MIFKYINIIFIRKKRKRKQYIIIKKYLGKMEFQNYEKNYKNIKRVTKIARKMLESLPDTIEKIVINGEILYSYLFLNAFININNINYNDFESFANEMKNIENTDAEFVNSPAFYKKREFIVGWIDFWYENELFVEDYIHLDLARFTNLQELNMSFIYVKDVVKIPETLTILKIISCETAVVDNIPNTLEIFNCNNNCIRLLPQLQNSNLKQLFCSSNFLRNIPNLPKTLEIFYCSQNYIKVLPKLSPQLEYLSCSDNKLVCVPELPYTIYCVQCANNNLSSIPMLPKSLKILVCNNNKIMKMPELPPFLVTFNCSKNPLKEYPILPPSIVNYTM